MKTNFVAALLFLASIPVIAQTALTTGVLRGQITDSTEAVLPGAQVVATKISTNTVFKTTSNSAGIFNFPALPVGSYEVTISAHSFRPAAFREVVVQLGQTAVQNIVLQPGASDASIRVSGEPPPLRPAESSMSTVVDRGLLSGLPLSGRRYTDFSLLSPNASPDGQSGLVSFGGEQGGEDTGYANGNGANSFTVDGANATSGYFGDARGGERAPYIFGENAIQEFQIAISPYSAAYGGAATGFLNTVTKSGGDAFHGNAFYYNRNSATGANDAIDRANGVPKQLNVLQQFGASVGGPVAQHRAWFFFDYEQQRQKNPISIINESFQNVSQVDFGVPEGVALPAPNASLPIPSALSAPDSSNPIYLQQVSNALNAIHSNLGIQSRFRNDLALFGKLDFLPSTNDRLYLSLNLNHFNSPNGVITASPVALFGRSTLANSYVRDYHAVLGWTHTFSNNLLSETHVGYSYDRQYSTPAGLMDPSLPTVLFSSPENFEIGNAGFANGKTKEWQIEFVQQFDYQVGRHSLTFGAQFNWAHVADSAFGGFDPDAQRQNGTFLGTYAFSSFPNFALGIYDSFAQSAGNPNFSFSVPFVGIFVQDTYQLRPRLTLNLGLRADFQVYPQPQMNPAFPLTGQFPNQYRRIAPRIGFAWQPQEKTVVRGGFGVFYENFNGLNYRNSVITNGLPTRQSSAFTTFNPDLAPNQQSASVGQDGNFGPVFPYRIANPDLFSVSPNISIVDPSFRAPYILQSSLQIEREILPNTTVSIGAMWTHGVHLISSSAYDLNLVPPTGTTTYITCPTSDSVPPCNGRQVTLPNLDSGLLREGYISPNLGQINALISPGINNYVSFFAQMQRRLSHGVGFQVAYTFAKNNMSNGVDFNNQFDFSNTRGPYLLDQRQRLSIAAVYEPNAQSLNSAWERNLLANWSLSTVMHFGSGRPYAALLDTSASGNILNDTAANQTTANSALGINGGGPSPVVGLNSFYGPWTNQVDVGLSRQFRLSERLAMILQAQAFNLFNHANYYVQNGTGVNPVQYIPTGSNCGDGQTLNQTCYLVPNTGPGNFGTLQSINALNGPRVFQFAIRLNF